MRLKIFYIASAIIMMFFSSLQVSDAAVGCTLNDPDRDVRRIFEKATNYTTEFISIDEQGGEELKEKIETMLQDTLEPVYESTDVPYAYYTVLHKKDVIGYIHGVNQKGMYGGMQLIVATDLSGTIVDFYYQKISSPEARKFKDDAFTEQFVGLRLEDFLEKDMTQEIDDPSTSSHEDFIATIRGIKKNLILADVFNVRKK